MAELEVVTIIGDLEIAYSGECHMQKDSQDLIIRLNDELILHIKFITDDKQKESTISISPLPDNEKEGDIEIVNFNSVMGSGILEPILIGDSAGKTIYFTFFTWKYGDGKRRFQYVFYLGKKQI
jgi:hypothetical protein